MKMLKPALVTILFVVTIFSFCSQEDQISVNYQKSSTIQNVVAIDLLASQPSMRVKEEQPVKSVEGDKKSKGL